MANMTNKFENDVLDGITGVTSLFSAGMSLALFTADPTDAGSVVNEMIGNGYERKLLSGLFPSATGTEGSVSNSSVIDFPTATAIWAEATHIGYMESDVEGADDMKVVVALDEPTIIQATKKFTLQVGQAIVTAK